MLFNSIEFILFLPLVLFGYSLFSKTNRTKFLILSSYFFYGWWNWPYLGLIIFSTLIDFFCGLQLEKTTKEKSRKSILGLSLLSNLGILLFFKYFNFFTSQVNQVFENVGLEYLIPYSALLLPMGISFYTFQTLSYTIDVYNRKVKAENDFYNFALYVSFFPQLVAGPIERAGHMLTQLKINRDLQLNSFVEGLLRVSFGLFKKLVIADRLALFVNQVYNDPTTYDGSILIIATVLFSFQIYCDFSGYSDIAIGTSKMFGIDLMENFKNPYLSKNIRSFWSSWHISLSSWFRDYLYIPLGGKKRKFVRNILVVFILSGLWHGANWTFIIWGTLHGLFLLITIFILKMLPALTKPVYSIPGKILTFSIVTFSWIFFRSNSMNDAWFIVTNIGNLNLQHLFDLMYQIKIGLIDLSNWSAPVNLAFGKIYFQYSVGDLILTCFLIPLLLVIETLIESKSYYFINLYMQTIYILLFLLMLSILFLGVFTSTQFIYFQF